MSCVKVGQNSSSSQYADMMSIISFSFLKCFTYFLWRGLFKINFKLPWISAYANLKFSLSSMASFAFFSSSTCNLDTDSWTFSWILIFSFGFCFLFSLSFFLFCLCFKKTFSLKLWVVNLVIADCLSFFVLPTAPTYRVDLAHVLCKFSFVQPGFSCGCRDNPFAVFVVRLIFFGIS